ncbi:glycoside hydrolase family 61 protein [Botryobasidium botryosum FD-172 SS1]|uniref:lytic cellulose monooxygenase (C4-dehydrogenating) n=1 Tax=Botryobasidium botryosum (strain FD-172 SS1) TaxID=930990 RepID=A0A067ML63_BOTB1|nr:glycoside hydrolase family 61 protein [Botryobasidium botryosum FD-172 SS1]
MLLSSLSFFVAGFLSLSVSGHYCFPSVDNTTAWDVVRRTDNYETRNPIKNVTDPNFRCYNGAGGKAAHTYTIAAGKNITFQTDNNLYHIGVANVYMAKASGDVMSFDGSGKVWFKIYQITAIADPTGTNYPTFPALGLYNVTFTIPKKVPTGQYLLRIEHIALHDAAYFGGAQFYIGCAQLDVTDGGGGTPNPLVSIPGVYTGREPGIIFDPYSFPKPTNYTQPGPPVWVG